MSVRVTCGQVMEARLLQAQRSDGQGRSVPATPCPSAALFGFQSGVTGHSDPSPPTILRPPTPAAASPSSCLGRWGVEELQPGWEGRGGKTRQVQEATSCPGRPWSLICGLAIVKPALLTCHLESDPPPLWGGGCGTLLIKGGFTVDG